MRSDYKSYGILKIPQSQLHRMITNVREIARRNIKKSPNSRNLALVFIDHFVSLSFYIIRNCFLNLCLNSKEHSRKGGCCCIIQGIRKGFTKKSRYIYQC